MRIRVTLVLVLLLFVASLGALAQVAHFLAIKGEGTASVFLDQSSTSGKGRTAYITDGGKGGRLGLGKATIRSNDSDNDVAKDVLQYLLDEHVTRLVITCSHPHDDHMAGLKTILRDSRMLQFTELVFIDNGYDKAQSLLEYFQKRPTPKPHKGTSGLNARPVARYVSAADSNAFAGLTWKDAAVKVSNFVYDPKQVVSSHGEDPIHGRSIITQYDITDPKKV